MSDPFVFRGLARVAVSTEDWAKADGAMLTEDGEVVPMVDLAAEVVDIDLTIDIEDS